MLYREFLKMDRQFESAVNLGLDLNKYRKLEEYIPTDSSVRVLKEYLKSINNEESERATVLIGPYGKGKSHLLLILCALIGMSLDDQENAKVLEKLIENIARQDVETAELARNIIKNNKRFIPVIINGGYGDLQQAFLIALKEALEREGIEELTPNTYYEVALKTIATWEKEYPHTLQLFKEKLGIRKYKLDELKDLLKNYDEKAYDVFCKLHPQVCSGSIFNPLINMDIVKMYKVVNDELCTTYGYSGIMVIFDEFSKFLENTKVQSSGELKVLQDFAELTNRQGNQIYLACITHKPIGNYTKELSKERALAYRAVEGRFREIYFVSSSEQNYELIKNSIQRDDVQFKAYVKENKDFFEKLKSAVANLGILPQGIDILDEIVEGCFPLHPMTTFMAIRISELVAQNERTLFTFLASHQKHTLRHFIETNKVKNKMLTMDHLYDYFKECFKKEMSNEVIATVFSQTENLLRRKMTKSQSKILKAMAIINMINQPSLIQARKEVLVTCIGEEEDIFDEAMNDLIRQHHVFKRNSDGVYICLNTSTVDVRNKINEFKQIKVRNFNRKDVLAKVIDLGFILPKQFNDEYEMIRFFKNEFITFNEVMALDSVEDMLKERRSDGVIWYLIYDETEDVSTIKDKIKQLHDGRLLIYVPNEAFEKDELLREYLAIEMLKEDKNFVDNDQPVLEELTLYQQDTVEAINNYITKYFALDNETHEWVAIDKMAELTSNKQLSSILSQICRRVYFNTPVIASELINKHNISGPILTARNKVVSNILAGNEYITKGNSPDITITRAVITNKGVHQNNVADAGLVAALEEIEQFIQSSDGTMQNIGVLYDVLMRAPYGMRKGIIPMYLAVYLKKYSNDIVLYNQLKEVTLDIETLKYIDKDPYKYDILLEKGTTERLKYIEMMDEVFEVRMSSSNFHIQCTTLVEKMKNWFRGLPKCSREFQGDSINSSYISEFRKQIVKFDINPREFLFDIIPNKVCKNKSLIECVVIIKDIKEKCESYFDELVNGLILETKQLFVPGYNGELSGALKVWHATLDAKLDQYMLDTQAKILLDIIQNTSNFNEASILSRLGFKLTGLHIEDWTKETSNEFLKQLQIIKDEVTQLRVDNEESAEGMQISIKFKGGVKQKILRTEEISSIGQTLFSNLEETLNEYSDSINASEKMSVLIQLIQSLM